MRIFFCSFLALVLIASCKQKDKKAVEKPVVVENKYLADSTLITDTSWGWVRSNATIDTLKKLYADSNVKDQRICGPECADSVDVTIIYPESNRTFIVYWRDSLYHKEISMIECYFTGSPYHTANGIRLGTTLKELLQINGKPIEFSGFGWDYGGGIKTYNNGALENSKLQFGLDIADDDGDNSVYGDISLDSNMPNVKKLLDKIHIGQFLFYFSKWETQ